MNRRIFSFNIPVYQLLVILYLLTATGCMRYLTQDRSKVLLKNVDIDQTLAIAKVDLERHKKGSSLTMWAIRDQLFSPSQARLASELYFDYVEKLVSDFDRWHFTWAIANIYRQGDDSVKNILKQAYFDAARRARTVHNLADRMVNGDKLYLGDAHGGGRAYARKHVVVPGNLDYIQSYEDYLAFRKKKDRRDRSKRSKE